jgi:hypothetical protein
MNAAYFAATTADKCRETPHQIYQWRRFLSSSVGAVYDVYDVYDRAYFVDSGKTTASVGPIRACASWHKRLDPIGFSVGESRWNRKRQTTEAGENLNASRELVDGTHIDGVSWQGGAF